jgi:hypothetical protein
MTATESLFAEAINDFCNKIGTKRTFRNVRYLVAIGCKADIARTES